MKVSNQELRQIIIEEVQTALFEMEEPGELNEFFGLLKKKKREALLKVENKIAAYFINNAKGIAQAVVPKIPYDNDIIENALKASVESGIKNNTKCATSCIMKFVTPDILKEELNKEPLKENIAVIAAALVELKPYIQAIMTILPLIPEGTKKSVVETLIKGMAEHPVFAAISPVGFGPIANYLISKIIQSKVEDEEGNVDDEKVSSLADSIIGGAESAIETTSDISSELSPAVA